MTAAVANPDDFGFGKFIGYSLVLHILLVAAIAASIIFHLNGQGWGDVGAVGDSATKVNHTSSSTLPGLPMPTPPTIDVSKKFVPTNSLFKEQPQPKPPEIP